MKRWGIASVFMLLGFTLGYWIRGGGTDRILTFENHRVSAPASSPSSGVESSRTDIAVFESDHARLTTSPPGNPETLEDLVSEANAKFAQNPDVLFVGKLVGKTTYLEGNPQDDQRRISAVLNSNLAQPLKDKFLVSYLGAAGGIDFSRVQNTIHKLAVDGSINQELVGESLRLLSFTNVKPAFDMLKELPWKKEYSGALVGIAANWVIDDPEKASDEVRNLKGLPAYDWAVAGLVQATRATDPSSAAMWLGEIRDSEALANANALTYTFRKKY